MCSFHMTEGENCLRDSWYWVTQKLPQIYTANRATFPIRIRKITVQICGNFWVTQYLQMVTQKWCSLKGKISVI